VGGRSQPVTFRGADVPGGSSSQFSRVASQSIEKDQQVRLESCVASDLEPLISRHRCMRVFVAAERFRVGTAVGTLKPVIASEALGIGPEVLEILEPPAGIEPATC
jgi:hypothetical protein